MVQIKSNFDDLYKRREESKATVKLLAVQLNILAMYDDHLPLSSALVQLGIVQKKLELIDSDHTQKEFSLMNELSNEYILHLDMVKYAFNERAKAYKSWMTTTEMLRMISSPKVRKIY